MRNEKIGRAKVFLHVAQQVQYLRLHRSIQRGHGLIAHHHLGPGDKRSGHGYALTLAARKFVRVPSPHAFKPHGGKHFVSQPEAFGPRDIACSKRLGNGGPGGKPWVERRKRILKNHLNLPGGPAVGPGRGQIPAAKQRPPLRRCKQTAGKPPQSRFAATRFAHKPKTFTGIKAKTHGVHSRKKALLGKKTPSDGKTP